jgi:hypothetical protein
MPATSASALNDFGQHIPARSDTPPLPPSMAPGPPDSSDFSGSQMPFLHGGLSFNLQHVTSESVAALAQQVVTPTLCQCLIRVFLAVYLNAGRVVGIRDVALSSCASR